MAAMLTPPKYVPIAPTASSVTRRAKFGGEAGLGDWAEGRTTRFNRRRPNTLDFGTAPIRPRTTRIIRLTDRAPATAAKATQAATKNRPAPKAKEAPAAPPAKKLSQFQAAIQVLAETGEPMTCRAMVEAMTAKGLWASPGGKTPESTLYASILRDTRKGQDAQFRKVDRGLFALASQE